MSAIILGAAWGLVAVKLGLGLWAAIGCWVGAVVLVSAALWVKARLR